MFQDENAVSRKDNDAHTKQSPTKALQKVADEVKAENDMKVFLCVMVCFLSWFYMFEISLIENLGVFEPLYAVLKVYSLTLFCLKSILTT